MSVRPLIIETARLRLVAATAEHVRLEIEDRARFAQALNCPVPEIWPPASAADALPWFLDRLTAEPWNVGWYAWYVIVHSGPLIGGAGFLGAPVNGVVETGFSLLPQYHGAGYAQEMINSLVLWAFSDPRVQSIAAETNDENVSSRRLLARVGFYKAGPGRDPGTSRYSLDRQRTAVNAPGPTQISKK
ncbi:MAG: GNAT family N-acetyltransferase [Gemmataceae bacterium]|nr:GNAT family N-acetyltransferase [Gemmataceae bacterium]